jgi:hypothetical protein
MKSVSPQTEPAPHFELLALNMYKLLLLRVPSYDGVLTMNRKFFLTGLLFVLVLPALPASMFAPNTVVFAQQAGSKEALTPTFWQRDPDADFEDEGRMHCAPTSVSDGLIYLARAYGLKGLVPGTGHQAQIKLIQELAEEFGTDPSIGGTNPDKILTGLQSYMKSRGYGLSRLELKSWRGVSVANKGFKTGIKPDMAWMRTAVRSKDTVVIFNFGWYYESGDGYERKGGHWVAVVGVASENEFIIHNPILSPEKQAGNKSVELTLLDEDFMVGKDSGEANMKGYYEGEGPGLPHGNNVTAILDSVIVFSIRK